MFANNGNRVQSNLQFQPLMSVKLSDDWNLITRPIIQMFSTTPFLDQTGQDKRVTAFGDTVLALALSLAAPDKPISSMIAKRAAR
jgi:hypothetical protein